MKHKSIPPAVIRNQTRVYNKFPTLDEIQEMNPKIRYYYNHRDERNLDKLHQYNKKYREDHKEYFRKKQQEGWERFKKKGYAEWASNHERIKRIELYEILGGAYCKHCGYADVRALQIDHINGSGNAERKKLGTRSFYVYYILKPELAKKRLQVLCANCNWIKRYDNKETTKGWSHEKK